uniref:Uncharacterized protein n=1 Tax=Dichotomaria marginata TaxID=268567 RepID=A0A1G4NSP7_9FLOR|nr:Hypothetical protein ORF_5 [Dichotomaria marginata]SCW21539.1 Hypothetical protein ORF_5 [Dichotomaria marginata]
MINLHSFGFFQKNIYYPKSWCNYISIKNKMIFILLYILLLPFISLNLVIFYTIVISLIFIKLPYKKISIQSIKKLTFYYLLFIILNLLDTSSYNKIYSFPYQAKIVCISFSKTSSRHKFIPIVYTYNNLLHIKLSSMSIRSFSILFNYLMLYQIITITTYLPDLLLYNINIFIFNSSVSSFIYYVIFILFLAYEFIFILEERIINLLLAITLKESDDSLFIFTFLKLFNLIYYQLIRLIYNEVLNFTNMIYLRELSTYKQDLWFI